MTAVLDLSSDDALRHFMIRLERYPLLTASDEVRLAKRVERGDSSAREKLIVSNLRLVIMVAKRYQRGVASNGATIRLPKHVRERRRKVSAAERLLTAQLAREPTDREIAAEAGVALRHVQELREAAHVVASRLTGLSRRSVERLRRNALARLEKSVPAETLELAS